MATLNNDAYFITKGMALSCSVCKVDWLKGLTTIRHGARTFEVPRHDVFYDLKRANNELEWRKNKPPKR
jgi:hypothetical protein